jgi:hypothetical protein
MKTSTGGSVIQRVRAMLLVFLSFKTRGLVKKPGFLKKPGFWDIKKLGF